MKLYFGKFLGFDIEEIPDSYLNWLLETNWFDKKYPQLVKPIDEELKYRQKLMQGLLDPSLLARRKR